MDKTSLGDRMKQYESDSDITLMRRCPVVIRVDGKGFSKWTKKKKLSKPFDPLFVRIMQDTMLDVASGIEGCVFGYTQSDEMTFILRNDQSLESEPWFGNRLQKVCSVVSSMVTANFNWRVLQCLNPATTLLAHFDARVFTVPDLDEAANALVWRQNDATKNSISTACYYEVAKEIGKGHARALMAGQNGKVQQEILFQRTGKNWNDYPTQLKRGAACYRKPTEVETPEGTIERKKWAVDKDIPVFTQNREWLMNRLNEVNFYG